MVLRVATAQVCFVDAILAREEEDVQRRAAGCERLGRDASSRARPLTFLSGQVGIRNTSSEGCPFASGCAGLELETIERVTYMRAKIEGGAYGRKGREPKGQNESGDCMN